MPAGSPARPGTLAWVELSAPNAEAARAFYGALFGWAVVEVPRPAGPPTLLLLQEGRAVAGCVQQSPRLLDEGSPALWVPSIACDDLEATAAAATRAGGSIAATTTPGGEDGRALVLTDPQGALLSVRQVGMHLEAEPRGGASVPVWTELATHDLDGASRFYNELFGWTTTVHDPAEAAPGATFAVHGVDVAWATAITDTDGPMPPHWRVHFGVASCDDTARRARDLGGTIVAPPSETPVGRTAVVLDPQGGVFIVRETAPADPV